MLTKILPALKYGLNDENWANHKPGSVFDDHLSRSDIADRLKRPTFRAATGSHLLRPFWSCSGWGLHGHHVSMMPVSSYLTISPLPQPDCFGGVFLLHFPYSYLRRTLSGTLALWSPDFPREKSRDRLICPIMAYLLAHLYIGACFFYKYLL